MHASKIAVIKTNLAECWTIHIDQIDYSVGQSCFFQYAHEHLSRIHLRVCTFPHDYIAAHGCGCWKVCTNSGEIERCDRKYKPFKRAILHTIVDTCAADR